MVDFFLDIFMGSVDVETFTDRPPVNVMEIGTKCFLVPSELFGSILDITRDELSSWTGTYRNYEDRNVVSSTKISFHCVVLDRGYFRKCEAFHNKNKCCSNQYKMKIFVNYHPRYDIRRKIAVVIDVNNKMVSPICYEYISKERIEHIPDKARILPSVSRVLGDVLQQRTTAQAKTLINSMKLNVTNSQLITKAKQVDSHMKSGRGRKTPSDVSKLFDLYARNVSDYMDVVPCEVYKIDNKIGFTQIVGFLVAIEHFCATLPTAEDFDEHLREINKLTQLTKSEANTEFGKILRDVTPSRSILNIGALLQIDTTFSLSSGEYVTYALGSSDMFQNKCSGKNSTIILGLMIHSNKHMKHHEEFARYLTKQFEKYGENKTLPGLISDGEPGFLPYTSGSFFGRSIKLRCDVHVIDNIKRLFPAGEKQEAQILIQFLYGRIEKCSNGTILQKGALVSFTYSTFSLKFDRLINDYPDKVKKWLLENKQSLFEHNSLISKLRSGQTQQFLSTNLIESKNSQIKQFIPKAMPAHKVIEVFRMLSENEIKERLDAILAKSEKLKTHFEINALEWNRMNNNEKMKKLIPYGLQNCFFESRFLKYPSWLVEGDGSLQVDKFMEKIDEIVVHPSKIEANIFFSVANDCIAKVDIQNNVMICSDSSCKRNKKYGFFLCSHCLAVFLQLEEECKTYIIETLSVKRESKTIKQVQASQLRPEDGSKFIRRKGTQETKGNYVREYDMLSSTLEHSDYLLISSDSEEETWKRQKIQKIIDSDDDY